MFTGFFNNSCQSFSRFFFLETPPRIFSRCFSRNVYTSSFWDSLWTFYKNSSGDFFRHSFRDSFWNFFIYFFGNVFSILWFSSGITASGFLKKSCMIEKIGNPPRGFSRNFCEILSGISAEISSVSFFKGSSRNFRWYLSIYFSGVYPEIAFPKSKTKKWENASSFALNTDSIKQKPSRPSMCWTHERGTYNFSVAV